jgi:hypothetical protein
MNKFFDYVLLVFLILIMCLAASCTPPTEDEIYGTPEMELDGRLPLDSNGYYHLELDSTTNQTIHTIGGRVTNIYEPTKVTWGSNLFWELNGEIVPTINGSSYVQDNGNINTVIAPVFGMRNDTLTIQAELNEWKIRQTIHIVLD